ncbi:MAG: heavy metal translocating P-type ATPase [Clostridiales bacterium]|nr:heavy metal translocating P-type ATPase [Clostridiales bacterium]
MAQQLSIVLDGLNCPHCAGRIEDKVRGLKNVQTADLNFALQELSVSYHDLRKDSLLNQVRGIANVLEPDIKVYEKSSAAKETAAIGLSRESKIRLARMAVGAVMYAFALTNALPPTAELFLYAACLIIFGYDVLIKAVTNIFRGELFDENFLMTLAAVGAFIVKQYPEAAAVVLFYQVGEFFQDLAVDRSRRSIKALINIKPDIAYVMRSGEVVDIPPAQAGVGEILIVKPGERIPLDGVITEGQSQLDMTSLLGESVPRTARPSDEVLSGSVNLTGLLKVRVTKTESESTASKIMELVENASAKKAPTERFITRFSKVYTPIVVSAAAVIALIPPLLFSEPIDTWVYRALVFLVISCPCALVVSVPLSFFSGIGACSKKGILVKGGNYLQALSEVDTVVFDKTGTLTKGVFRVNKILPAAGLSETYLLKHAYLAEKNSLHPVAKSLIAAAQARFKDADKTEITGFREITGMGVEAFVSDWRILAGSGKLMLEHGFEPMDDNSLDGVVTHVASGGKYLGCIVVSDEIKPDSAAAVAELKRIGVKRTVMLSGDRKESAEAVGARLGITKVFAGLLPHEKVSRLERIYGENPGAKVLFAGDGINDAPVLARADIGAAMGGVGSDAAVTAADIVIMNDEPSKIPEAILTARNTMRIARQNIVFALAVKFAVLILAAFGYAGMWMAVFADVGVEVLVVLNAMRRK